MLILRQSEVARIQTQGGNWLGGLSTVAATLADNQPSPDLLLYSEDVID